MASDSKVALLCAYTLASAERYGEAEALILSDIELAKTSEAMDLLARIRSEQGDLAEARRLWQEIQSIHPEHKPSALALKALTKRPRTFSSKAVRRLSLACALLLGVLFGGMCCAALGGGRRGAPLAVVTWDNIPTGAQIQALTAYQGKVGRVFVSSSFFNHPKRANHRAMLTEYLASALAIPTQEIYLGAPQPGQSADAIRVELEKK